MTWDGFDVPVAAFKIRVSVELRRSGSTLWEGLIHDTGKVDTSQGSDWGGPGEEISLQGDYGEGRAGYVASDADWGIIQRNREHIYNDGYPLPNNPAPASDLYADTDGSTTKTRVVLKAEYALYRGSGAELTGTSGYPDRPQFSTDFVVTVENQTATTGSGDADAQGDTGDDADVGV